MSVHKAGFVNIIGSPNVGKSTLMNELVGERLSIITNKAQTTRHRILGIVNGEDFQIIYSDTPGVLKPVYKLQETMLQVVNEAFNDADVMILVLEAGEEEIKNEEIFHKLISSKTPLLILINKIDTIDQEKLHKLVEHWKSKLPNAEILPISALNKFNISMVQIQQSDFRSHIGILYCIPNRPLLCSDNQSGGMYQYIKYHFSNGQYNAQCLYHYVYPKNLLQRGICSYVCHSHFKHNLSVEEKRCEYFRCYQSDLHCYHNRPL